MKFAAIKPTSKLYKVIYTTYLFLDGTVLKTTSLIGPVITILTIASFLLMTGDWALASICYMGFYILLWFFGKFLWWLIQHAVKNGGIERECIFAGNYIVPDSDGYPFVLKLDDINPDRFEMATSETAHISADLNIRAFGGSQWGTSYEDKFARNSSHIEKNALSIMFVKSLVEGKYLGYTHILAVTKATWDCYCRGELEDNAFSDKFVAADPPHSSVHKQPYGLILFSVASVAYDTEQRAAVSEPGDLRKIVGDLYEQAMAIHLNKYLSTQFKDKKTVSVLFQNMNERYLDLFRKVSKRPVQISADGAYIIVFEVSIEQ